MKSDHSLPLYRQQHNRHDKAQKGSKDIVKIICDISGSFWEATRTLFTITKFNNEMHSADNWVLNPVILRQN